MKTDRDYGDGLTRLADPQPYVWLRDKKAVLTGTLDIHGHGVRVYGNFWPSRPCRIRPHRWLVLMTTDVQPPWAREVRRCQRCGAQVHQEASVRPPVRGEL